MQNTKFVNVHGLDDDNHLTTARDMSIMARELLKHEEILNYTSIYEEFLNKPDGTRTWMVNTNKLIKYYNGLDGLKQVLLRRPVTVLPQLQKEMVCA